MQEYSSHLGVNVTAKTEMERIYTARAKVSLRSDIRTNPVKAEKDLEKKS